MSMNNRINNQSGFSLVEILISVLVFGVGVLGLTGLQVASLKGSNNAHYRTTASVLAMDLGDRMRSNINAVRDGLYGEAVSCNTVSRLCRSSACTKEELAVFDLQEVMCGSKRGSEREGGVVGLLPNGRMRVTCDAGCVAPPNALNAVHNIVISWNENKTVGATTNDDQSRSLTMQIIP